MPPSLDQARVALAAQPFSRLLGAQINCRWDYSALRLTR